MQGESGAATRLYVNTAQNTLANIHVINFLFPTRNNEIVTCLASGCASALDEMALQIVVNILYVLSCVCQCVRKGGQSKGCLSARIYQALLEL